MSITPAAWGQHDVQRDAVRHVARGEFDKAAQKLASDQKPNAGPSETLFVEMLSLLAQVRIDAAEIKAKEALATGLPPSRFAAEPRSLLSKLPPIAGAQAIGLVHGPMLGNLSSDGVGVWIRFRTAAEVTVVAGGCRATVRTRARTGFTATFKVIASCVPFTPNIKKGSRDPWDGFPEERAEIFSWIPEHDLEGVFFIAADRHRTDLRTIGNPGSYTLYEFQSSKLTNKHTHPVVKTDGLLWGYNKTCSFGLMHFDTTLDDPQVRFELVDIDGEAHEEHTLRLSELKAD